MSVAEQTAVSNLSNILGKLHWIFPLEVMGVLIVLAVYKPTMIADLRISSDATLSIMIMLILGHILQPVYLSVFPSLLLTLVALRRVMRAHLILRHETASRSAAGIAVRTPGQSGTRSKCILIVTLFFAFIVICNDHIDHGLLLVAEVTPGVQKAMTAVSFPSPDRMGNHGPLRVMGEGPFADLARSQKTIWIEG